MTSARADVEENIQTSVKDEPRDAAYTSSPPHLSADETQAQCRGLFLSIETSTYGSLSRHCSKH